VSLAPSDVLDGKWRIERELGRGGMAAVFLAHEIALDRRVALKILDAQICADTAMVARFEREARLMAQLDHPNIVPVLAVGTHGVQPFIVMKYLEGRTLREHLKDCPNGLSDSETLAILRQLCSGLAYMHGRALVHRDIKPGNVFLSPEGHVTILDLGVARDLKSRPVTQAGFVLGTPEYMAPEQITGAQEVDRRSDLYSLGVLVFEMLSGRLPFDGSNALSLAERHANAAAPDLSEVAPWVSSPIGSLLKRALAKRPDDRFQSAEDFLGAFSQAVNTNASGNDTMPEFATIPTDPALPIGVSGAVAVSDLATRSTEPVPKKPWLRRLAWAGGASIFVAILAVAWPRSTPRFEAPASENSEPPKAHAEAAPAPEAAPPPSTPVSTTDLPSPTGVASSMKTSPLETPPARSTLRTKSVHRVAEAPRQKPGQLRVIALEHGQLSWASVFVDGEAQGEAPVSLSLTPGAHKLRVERSGYPTIRRDATVAPGQASTVKIEIAP
jgi:eukaryotic-like serine/threonine-protein kinase